MKKNIYIVIAVLLLVVLCISGLIHTVYLDTGHRLWHISELALYVVIIFVVWYGYRRTMAQEKGISDRLRRTGNQLQESEQRLIDANEKLIKVDKLKSEFIRNVSHEIRTPITVIKESASILDEGICGELNEKQSKFIKIQIINIDRLVKIIEDILNLSHLELGNLKPDLKSVNISLLIQNIYGQYQHEARKKGISLSASIFDGTILADSNMLTQVFSALLGNALRFASSEITISAINAEKYIEFHIENDGREIDEESIEQIFDKFVQPGEPHVSGTHKGVGIGLALCKDIVEQCGGKIWAENRPEGGLVFKFTIPVTAKSGNR